MESLARIGPHSQPDVAVLPAPAGLTDVLALRLDFPGDGLAVRDLRLADVGFDLVLAAHAVDDDLQVQLAHPRDDGLAGFLVGAHAEGRVFNRQPLQRGDHLLLIGGALRLDGDVHHRRGELHPLQNDGVVRIAQRVAGGDVLQAHHGGDVAREDLVDLFALVGVHPQEPADALAAPLGRVVDRLA